MESDASGGIVFMGLLLLSGLLAWVWERSMAFPSLIQPREGIQSPSTSSEHDIRLPSVGLAYPKLEQLTLSDLLEPQDSSEYLRCSVVVDAEVDLLESSAKHCPSLSRHQEPGSSHS